MLEKNRDLDVPLAQLLVSADFLKPHHFDRAYAACRDDGLQLRQVLLENRMVDERIIDVGTEVITEVYQGRLPLPIARTVMYLMGHCRLPLAEAMLKLGVEPVRNPWQHRLDALELANRQIACAAE